MSQTKASDLQILETFAAELSGKKLVFPTSLGATMKIRRALANPDIAIEQVVRVVASEPVLSAKVLALANSASLNPQARKVSDLRSAVTMLGMTALRNLALAVGLKQLAENQYTGNMAEHMHTLWQRSLRVAACAMVLARQASRVSPDKAMLAGLLHDIGKFYILNRAHHYQASLGEPEAIWPLLEQWHLSIGNAILEDWDVPEDIRLAITDYRDYRPGSHGKPGLPEVLVLADQLQGYLSEQASWQEEGDLPAAAAAFELDGAQLAELLEQARLEYQLVLQAIN